MKIFYLINGMGLGNSVRADAVIESLKTHGWSVTLFTSGNGVEYFKDDPRVEAVIPLQAQGVYPKKRSLSGALKLVTLFLKNIFANSFLFVRHVKQEKPQLILTDSIYLPALLLYRSRWAAINNSDYVVENYSFRLATALQFGVELMDYFFHKLFCRWVFSPRIVQGPSRSPFVSVGMTVRQEGAAKPLLPPQSSSPLRVGVIYSGSGLSSGLEQGLMGLSCTVKVLGASGPVNEKFKYLGRTRSVRDLEDVDLIVGNAGFLTISDILYLKKPMVLCPLPHHAEQEVNARTIHALGVGIKGPFEAASLMVQEMGANLKSYEHRLTQLPLDFTGADQIAARIQKLLNEK